MAIASWIRLLPVDGEKMRIFLETERLILRQFTDKDTRNLFELDSDPEVTRFTPQAGQPPDYTVIQTRILPKFLTYYEKYEGYGVWAALEKSSQAFIGWFFLRPAVEASYFNPILANPTDVELGYRLRKAFWGKGYATEGARALVVKGFSELGAQRIVAPALSANVASIRVLEKSGLKLQHQFVDETLGQEVVIYVLQREE